MTPAGLEPAIPGSVGRCLIHWATGPVVHPKPRDRLWQTKQNAEEYGRVSEGQPKSMHIDGMNAHVNLPT